MTQKNDESQVYALAILESGNYALHLLNILKKKNLYCEFMSIPCPIARAGCGYCLKFPIIYLETVLETSKENGLIVKAVYEIKPLFLKNKYIQILP